MNESIGSQSDANKVMDELIEKAAKEDFSAHNECIFHAHSPDA